MTDTRYLSRREAARYLSERGIIVKPETLARWACTGRYSLPYHKVGKMISYRADDLDELIERHRIVPSNGESHDRAQAGGG